MQLSCPKCESFVQVEDDGMPAKRRPVRCSSCGESWFTGGKTDLYALSFAKPNDVDPQVARILQEEAGREMAAREADDEARLNAASNLGEEDPSNSEVQTSNSGNKEDGYVTLNWRQRGFVLCLCLLGGLVAIYTFASDISEAFPRSTDWIVYYVFWVNDMRYAIYDVTENLNTFFTDLHIGATAGKIKAGLIDSVQAFINFLVNLGPDRSSSPKS